LVNPAGFFVYIIAMSRLPLTALALCLAGSSALAQDAPTGQCTTPDSIVVRGNERVAEATVRGAAGLAAGAELNYRIIQRALKDLYATTEFEDVQIVCEPGVGRAVLAIVVKERPLLAEIAVTGVDRLSGKSVRDKIEIPTGKALDPALVSKAVARIDSLYEANAYYLARIRPETTMVGNDMRLTFRIEEGHRLAISGIRVNGNSRLASGEIVGAMKTRPEGFFWWRRGAFDEDNYAGDLGERIPELYAKRGFIDFQIAKDTVIIDRTLGKGLVELTVDEGARYRVGSFEVIGNKLFSSDQISQFYPFAQGGGPSLTQRVTNLVRRRETTPEGVFDQARWEEATQRIKTAYNNEGYIYSSVRPVVERRIAPDSTRFVDLRWEVDEKSPAIINRIEIIGNDYTTESCIRDQLLIVPGDVFNQDRLIRSYYQISNLGLFEAPLPPPDTRTANEQGDVDIIFNVKEKSTGNVNFGASMGQATGVGGFIGLDQPNLFGQCKRGSLQWQFGRYINDFNLSYSDPRIKQSQISGTVSAYRTLARYNIADLGRSLRTGGSVQFGFRLRWGAPFTMLFLSYGGENVKFGTSGLLGETRSEVGDGFRSTVGLTTSHDTRINMPFATGGGMQSFSAQFNGGPLGGSAAFQRYTAETRAYAPIGQLGGKKPGSQPIVFVLGLTTKAGAVFGNTGPFFFSQEFALGGVQFGEQLRGYDEFSIAPTGFVTGTSTFNAQRQSFGKAYFTTTAEAGMRVNQSLYLNLFYDAGNVYSRARQFDPTRLFRGAGIGVSTITPLGPLGLDYAYGFDALDADGRKAPKWKLHFRLGQLF
jgi:outer membrane protein insertion porin family